jgi:homocysteine S-methyltransferase
MASYAKRFVTSGVRLVGGCCGTTPEHIRQIKASVGREGARRVSAPPRTQAVTVAAVSAPVVPRGERSALARAFAERRFVTMAELVPPKGHVTTQVLERARALKSHGVDVLLIPDGPRGARMSAQALAVLVQQQTSIEVVLQYLSRRNLLGMSPTSSGAPWAFAT